MAQGPKDLIKKFENEVALFEQQIDAQLSKIKLIPGNPVIITISNEITNEHFKALVDRYIDAGWAQVSKKEKWVGSKEDGRTERYLEFKN